MNDIDATLCNSASRRESRVGEVVAGLIAILIGFVFLADNFGIEFPIFGLHNWWAVFILVGAVAPASRAVRRYRSIGAVDARAAHWMLSAATAVTVGLMFLLELSFAQWWPIFVVIGGFSMLISGGRRRDRTMTGTSVFLRR